MTTQTVLKTLKTHKLSDTAVENACWVLGNVVVALPITTSGSITLPSWPTPERDSSPVTIGAGAGVGVGGGGGTGFDIVSLDDSPNTTTDDHSNPTTTTGGMPTTMTSFSSSSSSSPLQALRDSVYQDHHHWDLLVGCVETHLHKEQAVRWLAAAVSVFADQGK